MEERCCDSQRNGHYSKSSSPAHSYSATDPLGSPGQALGQVCVCVRVYVSVCLSAVCTLQVPSNGPKSSMSPVLLGIGSPVSQTRISGYEWIHLKFPLGIHKVPANLNPQSMVQW